MMKKRFFIALAFAFVATFTIGLQDSNAKGLIVWGTSDKMEKIADLPDSEDYQTTDGLNFDMGVKYSVFHIFWIPLWVTNEAMACGYLDGDNYVELTEEDVQLIAEANSIDMNGKVKTSFWNSYGGKVLAVFVLLILLVVYVKK